MAKSVGYESGLVRRALPNLSVIHTNSIVSSFFYSLTFLDKHSFRITVVLSV